MSKRSELYGYLRRLMSFTSAENVIKSQTSEVEIAFIGPEILGGKTPKLEIEIFMRVHTSRGNLET